MPDPQDVTQGIGDFLRQGLGIFGQGVSTVAQGLRSMDTAVREVDGALTGRGAPATPVAPSVSEEELAQRVASLVQQAEDEVGREGSPRSPGVVQRFQETVRLLFQAPLGRQSQPGGMGDLFPSPVEAMGMALRGLRGSMALVRLANGAGSLSDLEEVHHLAADLAGHLQGAAPAQAAAEPQAIAPEAPAPNPTPAPAPNPRSSRRRPSRQQAREPVNPSAVGFARAMAEEMGDSTVRRWAKEMEAGKLSEDQFIDRWSKKLARGKSGDPEDLLQRAKARAIRNGLPPDDPYLGGI